MSDYELIKLAIQNKSCITCTYNGHIRKMTPHVIGNKNGIEKALFYQYDGESSEGLSKNPVKNWRCFVIAKIEDLKLNEDAFQTANNHSRKQNCVDEIDLEIDY